VLKGEGCEPLDPKAVGYQQTDKRGRREVVDVQAGLAMEPALAEQAPLPTGKIGDFEIEATARFKHPPETIEEVVGIRQMLDNMDTRDAAKCTLGQIIERFFNPEAFGDGAPGSDFADLDADAIMPGGPQGFEKIALTAAKIDDPPHPLRPEQSPSHPVGRTSGPNAADQRAKAAPINALIGAWVRLLDVAPTRFLAVSGAQVATSRTLQNVTIGHGVRQSK